MEQYFVTVENSCTKMVHIECKIIMWLLWIDNLLRDFTQFRAENSGTVDCKEVSGTVCRK
jgi:hypothetical protein